MQLIAQYIPFASPFSIPIVAIIAVFTWMIISSIVATVQGIVKHRNEVELKQSMVDRGMTAEEIERVVQATSLDDSEEQA